MHTAFSTARGAAAPPTKKAFNQRLCSQAFIERNCHTPPHAPARTLTDLLTTALMATVPKIGSGTFYKRRLYVACSLGVPFLTLPTMGSYSKVLSFGGS
jgi:hypothetical protein